MSLFFNYKKEGSQNRYWGKLAATATNCPFLKCITLCILFYVRFLSFCLIGQHCSISFCSARNLIEISPNNISDILFVISLSLLKLYLPVIIFKSHYGEERNTSSQYLRLKCYHF